MPRQAALQQGVVPLNPLTAAVKKPLSFKVGNLARDIFKVVPLCGSLDREKLGRVALCGSLGRDIKFCSASVKKSVSLCAGVSAETSAVGLLR